MVVDVRLLIYIVRRRTKPGSIDSIRRTPYAIAPGLWAHESKKKQKKNNKVREKSVNTNYVILHGIAFSLLLLLML